MADNVVLDVTVGIQIVGAGRCTEIIIGLYYTDK